LFAEKIPLSEENREKQKKPIDQQNKVTALIEDAGKQGATVLDLSYEELTELPESLGQLTQLHTLYLRGNKLSALPERLGQLTRLQVLYLDSNQLSVLPESLGQLTQLRTLRLDENQLSALPESLGQLTQLQTLNLHSNQLSVLPESLGQLTQLQELSLHINQLSVLPESLGQLTQLQELYLHNNQLSALPESLGQLTRLQELYLHNNQLSALPESLGQLTQLRTLYLSGNKLSALPESLGQLTQLQELYLHINQLSVLPKSLRNLESLQRIYLHGNDALGLPIEVLGPTWLDVRQKEVNPIKPSEILDYYFRAKRPLNEAKLILVGRGAVGKTSLVNRLVHEIFQDEKKTEGIKITKWKIRLHTDEDVQLNVWDFGGQEIMHATHQFFLTQRSLYILVLNGREGGEDMEAEYWLKLIESFGDESPVIVVLNKIKEHPFDLNRRALLQKYSFIVRDSFIRTDCEDGMGCAELRRIIERETDRLEHLRDGFPESWFSIKDRLAHIEKNYLGFDEYRDICLQLGEKGKAAQDALAGYLHNLGIALNYKDDPRLQDTHVLNPHWVTNGIYKILNSEKLEEQKGEIRLNDLSKILNETEYPRSMHRFIFDLMKKFELCFSFPDDECHYLIPELLDKQEPEAAAAFKPEECLNFQYHYPILPEGLLPRFIVRTHVLSEGSPRWRTGVILKFGDSRALVKADVQDKQVFIHIAGKSPRHRRELLAIIRSDFERIHYDIRNLQPREMVPVPGYPDTLVPYKELLVREEKGRKTFEVVVGDEMIDADVLELLNGVDLEGTRRRETPMEARSEAVRVLISYSHRDDNLRNELQTHLKLLQRQGIIDAWDDRQIDAGDEWKRKIDDNLERADIILLLVSADFIASDYCYEIEGKRALERHDNNEACVIPVIVRDVNWSGAPFAKLQALPKDGKAVALWPDKDTAWRNVSEGIQRAAEQIRKRSGRS
jgi:internalin A